jgi:hypothetical protein
MPSLHPGSRRRTRHLDIAICDIKFAARRLETLERSVAALDANTRQEFVRVYKAILKLMGPASGEQ